ncbi:hypothetical protein [Dyadobacter pollutisoli]|uniref:hypothetical protein n=1 Tax=Dyadobacter pollutisoli TaxID=2910158 RepID=UPI001FD01839|nr:hypothetical protein [Dyadobacter pollutisoli]
MSTIFPECGKGYKDRCPQIPYASWTVASSAGMSPYGHQPALHQERAGGCGHWECGYENRLLEFTVQ